MSTTSTTRPSYRGFAVEVVEACDVSPTFRRLTLAGPDLHECGDRLLDQRVKLVLATREQLPRFPLHDGTFEHWLALPDTERPPMRTYTLAAVDRRGGTVDVDVACRPAHGPASRFAQRARPGDPVILVGPDAGSPGADRDGIAWRGEGAGDVLLVADETAVPALRNILASLPAHVTGHAVVEVRHADDALGLRGPAGVDVLVVIQAGPVGQHASAVLRGLRAGAAPRPFTTEGCADELVWHEAGAAGPGTYGWLAGEAGWIRSLRVELGGSGWLPRGSASYMGYWKQGAPSP